MLDEYLPLLIMFLVAVALGLIVLALGMLLGPKRRSLVKGEAFECGNPSSGTARQRFGVKFFMVAILFLVFDIEAVFIYPWAVVVGDMMKNGETSMALFCVVEMVVFVGIVVVGLAYAWRKGALEWGPEPWRRRAQTTTGPVVR